MQPYSPPYNILVGNVPYPPSLEFQQVASSASRTTLERKKEKERRRFSASIATRFIPKKFCLQRPCLFRGESRSGQWGGDTRAIYPNCDVLVLPDRSVYIAHTSPQRERYPQTGSCYSRNKEIVSIIVVVVVLNVLPSAPLFQLPLFLEPCSSRLSNQFQSQ